MAISSRIPFFDCAIRFAGRCSWLSCCLALLLLWIWESLAAGRRRNGFAPKTSLTWRAVAPSEGLTPAEPLTRLADDVALTLTWSDTKPEDTAYEGLVVLLAPPDRYLVLCPMKKPRAAF